MTDTEHYGPYAVA